MEFIYLNFDVSDFVDGPNDRPADHRRKYVRRKIAAGIAAFDKLEKKNSISISYHHHNHRDRNVVVGANGSTNNTAAPQRNQPPAECIIFAEYLFFFYFKRNWMEMRLFNRRPPAGYVNRLSLPPLQKKKKLAKPNPKCVSST